MPVDAEKSDKRRHGAGPGEGERARTASNCAGMARSSTEIALPLPSSLCITPTSALRGSGGPLAADAKAGQLKTQRGLKGLKGRRSRPPREQGFQVIRGA